MPGELHIELLGGFCLKYKGEQITSVDTPRLMQLVAYLLLYRDKQLSRQYVAFQFWPDSTEKQALTNLRNLLYLLRKGLPQADLFLNVDNKIIQWNTEAPFTLDVAEFESFIEQAKSSITTSHKIEALKKAIEIYRGTLLPECYEKWIEQHRQYLQDKYDYTLKELIHLLENKERFEEAIHFLKKRIQHNSLNEAAWRKLIKLHVRNNNRPRAIQAYKSCINVLQEEFDVGPDRKTKELYEHLLTGNDTKIDAKELSGIKTANKKRIQGKKFNQKKEIESNNTDVEYRPLRSAYFIGLMRKKGTRAFLYSCLLLILLLLLGGYYFFAGSSPKIDSVAVLPFENLSGDAGQEYFVDGMTEALTAELGQIKTLKVISRTSAMHYKNTNKLMPEIARELDVDALIEGSVRQAGDTVQLTLQLIHGPKDEHIWSNSYTRELQNILILQTEIAQTIAGEIQITLAPEEQARLNKKNIVDPEAYRLWLKGNFQMMQLSIDAFRRALNSYQKAIAIDSSYAEAYAGLAMAYIMKGGWHGTVPPKQIFPKAKEAAEQALALDSTVAEAYFVLARIRQLFEWDWEGAERSYRRGIELNPSTSFAWIMYANFLTSLGRFQEAIEVNRRAVNLDPLLPNAYNELAFSLWLDQRNEEAYKIFKESLELDPDFHQTHLILVMYYQRKGNSKKTLSHLKISDQNRDLLSPRELGYIGYHYAVAGKISEAKSILSELLEYRANGYVSASTLADIFLGLNEHQEALKWLEQAYKERDPSMVWLNVAPWYNPLRSYSQFQDLINRMDFPEY